MSIDKPTPDEVLAAQALAQALEGDGASPEVPENALQAAALLRYSHEAPLDEGRQDALFAELVRDAVRPAPVARNARPFAWFWAAVATAAAVTLALSTGILEDPGPPDASTLPPPQIALLEAQLAATQPGDLLSERTDEFARQMQEYRGDMYTALSAHYTER